MKLKVTQSNLNQALNAVSRVANTRGTLPVLANILIKASKGILLIAATNLDIGITKFVGAKIEKEGSITVPANILTSFVSSLPQGIIDLSLEDNKLKVVTDQYNCVINGISADEFPVIPVIESKQEIKVNAKDFKKSLNQVLFAASSNDNRPVLTGVYIYSKNNNLYMVATDSSRLSESIVCKTKENINMLVPSSSLSDLYKIIDDQTSDITILKDEQQVLFKFSETELVSRLLENNYPDYQNLIPTDFSNTIEVNRQEFLNMIKVSSIFAKETAGSLTIAIDQENQTINIKSLASQIGENSAVLKAKIKGTAEITLNSRFIIEALNVLEGENINFCFNGKIEPILLKDPNEKNFIHIIMPLKV